MKSIFLTLLRYGVYIIILWFCLVLFYYSYWSNETYPEGLWLDAYYVAGCLALILLMKPTRGLSWLLLPLLYLFANGVLGWGSINMMALSVATGVSVIMVLVHFFWLYKPKKTLIL